MSQACRRLLYSARRRYPGASVRRTSAVSAPQILGSLEPVDLPAAPRGSARSANVIAGKPAPMQVPSPRCRWSSRSIATPRNALVWRSARAPSAVSPNVPSAFTTTRIRGAGAASNNESRRSAKPAKMPSRELRRKQSRKVATPSAWPRSKQPAPRAVSSLPLRSADWRKLRSVLRVGKTVSVATQRVPIVAGLSTPVGSVPSATAANLVTRHGWR